MGQTSGRKVDGEVVVREMRRTQGLDSARLFNVTEFLNPQQISSYFSCLAAKLQKQLPDVAMFRPAKRKSTSRWQGIWPYKPSAPNSVGSVRYLYHGEERHVEEAKAWHAAEYLPELGAECSCACRSTKSTIPCVAW